MTLENAEPRRTNGAVGMGLASTTICEIIITIILDLIEVATDRTGVKTTTALSRRQGELVKLNDDVRN